MVSGFVRNGCPESPEYAPFAQNAAFGSLFRLESVPEGDRDSPDRHASRSDAQGLQRAPPIVRRFAKDPFALADLVERAFPQNHLLEERSGPLSLTA